MAAINSSTSAYQPGRFGPLDSGDRVCRLPVSSPVVASPGAVGSSPAPGAPLACGSGFWISELMAIRNQPVLSEAGFVSRRRAGCGERSSGWNNDLTLNGGTLFVDHQPGARTIRPCMTLSFRSRRCSLPESRARHRGPSADRVASWIAVTFSPVGRLLLGARAQCSTWEYWFAWSTPRHGGRLGARHGAELAFVFDTLLSDGADWLLGPEPPHTLGDTMHRAWLSFAGIGEPGWRRSTKNRATMVFNTH
jgi:hypothetical protein